MAATPTTPTGVKPGDVKKSYSELVGVDVFAAGLGLFEDMASVAAERRAPTQPSTATTNPK